MVARYLIEKKLTIEIDKDAISHPLISKIEMVINVCSLDAQLKRR
ncbi:hypothetical protein [Psychromonas antarctica]|nr:hypothetical protein [Psychromonas antarctica]